MAPLPVEVSLEPDPVIEVYKKDVDRTLLRERLKRSVEERLRDLTQMQAIAEELRRAGRKAADVEELDWKRFARRKLAHAWEGEDDALYDHL